MKTEKYLMSFTGGGLLRLESARIAGLFLEYGNWDKVREEIFKNNLLQTRTVSSTERICREVCSRLKELHHDELKILSSGTAQEQGYLLWIAICRRYRFLRDFSIEILRERFLTFRQELNIEDYDAFFHAKVEWHVELESITPTTRKKARQVLFRMLHEADLLSTEGWIVPAILTHRLIEAVAGHSYQDLLLFPIPESDLRGRLP